MTTKLDVQSTWWWWQTTRRRLTLWTKALLQGRRYRIVIEPFTGRDGTPGTGFHAPEARLIRVNPAIAEQESPGFQFQLTQGVLGHEVGHALFTDAWPKAPGQDTLRWLVNVLEDERMERSTAIYYPGLRALFDRLGLYFYARFEAFGKSQAANQQALGLCLAWRWAKRQSSESEMFTKLKVSEAAQNLWMQIKDLVETSWNVPTTTELIELAKEILRLLDIPAGQRVPDSWWFVLGDGDGIPVARLEEPLPFPDEAADVAPGVDEPPDERDLPDVGRDAYTEPKPYLELEQEATPLANALAASLVVRNHSRPKPHEYRGRYSFRQEIRTPERPHIPRAALGQSSDGIVIYLLADRSGSMVIVEESVRLALMMIALAAEKAGIPLGMAFFGSSTTQEASLTLEVTPIAKRIAEQAKALIAGFRGVTNAEFLHRGLQLAESSLLARPERRKFLLVIHDGQPTSQDFSLSMERLQSMERKGITPIGIFLGDNPEDALRQLFPKLVITQVSSSLKSWACCSKAWRVEFITEILQQRARPNRPRSFWLV